MPFPAAAPTSTGRQAVALSDAPAASNLHDLTPNRRNSCAQALGHAQTTNVLCIDAYPASTRPAARDASPSSTRNPQQLYRAKQLRTPITHPDNADTNVGHKPGRRSSVTQRTPAAAGQDAEPQHAHHQAQDQTNHSPCLSRLRMHHHEGLMQATRRRSTCDTKPRHHARTSDPEHVSRPNQAPPRPNARRSSHQQGSERPRSKKRPQPMKIPPTPKPQTTPQDQPQDAARPRRSRPGCSRQSASSQACRSSLTNKNQTKHPDIS